MRKNNFTVIVICISSIFLNSCELFERKKVTLLTGGNILEIGANYIHIEGLILDVDAENPISAYGHVLSTSPEPLVTDSVTNFGERSELYSGKFISFIDDLEVDTQYFVRSYTITNGEVKYGNERSFYTNSVEISGARNITNSSVTFDGSFKTDRNLQIVEHGHCLALGKIPTLNDADSLSVRTELGVPEDGVNTFSSSFSENLNPGTYYACTYIINNEGTVFFSKRQIFTITLN